MMPVNITQQRKLAKRVKKPATSSKPKTASTTPCPTKNIFIEMGSLFWIKTGTQPCQVSGSRHLSRPNQKKTTPNPTRVKSTDQASLFMMAQFASTPGPCDSHGSDGPKNKNNQSQ